ncbi:hypothetical protein VFPBJ_02971 [Purpureocillium lilacinum]|uniref:Uncharacterized protein n=1 Tax=Purpureocillium lilacinum TaxID=33203 RepID=A0A179H3W9_PURLI|nr:hypothetical protein VFPBJ_02971 [Purpureocillium lilacinum]
MIPCNAPSRPSGAPFPCPLLMTGGALQKHLELPSLQTPLPPYRQKCSISHSYSDLKSPGFSPAHYSAEQCRTVPERARACPPSPSRAVTRPSILGPTPKDPWPRPPRLFRHILYSTVQLRSTSRSHVARTRVTAVWPCQGTWHATRIPYSTSSFLRTPNSPTNSRATDCQAPTRPPLPTTPRLGSSSSSSSTATTPRPPKEDRTTSSDSTLGSTYGVHGAGSLVQY